MIVAIIIACEIGFWLILAAGLGARYVLRQRVLGAVLLACVPVVDLVLLVAATIDLRDGATANWTHGLAAAYLGLSIVFGHSMVRWLDARFAYRFAGGEKPTPPPRTGRARTRREWKAWAMTVVSWLISCGLLVAAIAYVGDPPRTTALEEWISRLTMIQAILTIFPIGWTIWPGPEPDEAKTTGHDVVDARQAEGTAAR